MAAASSKIPVEDRYPVNPEAYCSPSHSYNSPQFTGSFHGSQVAFTEGDSGGLAFVPPRIMNRSVRPPTRNNHESGELQYEEEQRKVAMKRQHAMKNQHRRGGTFELSHEHPESEAPHRACEHNRYEFQGTFDPVKGICLNEDIEDRAGHISEAINSRHQPHHQRGRTPYSSLHYNSFNPMTCTWASGDGVNRTEMPDGSVHVGRTPIKAYGKAKATIGSTGVTSMGNYNPITNEWIQPPDDPKYLDREQKFYY